jgi:hypothetical protein
MKTITEHITRCLVKDPDAVFVSELQGTRVTVLELRVAPNDKGRVIGRQGRVVHAMRTLLCVVAAKKGKRVTLEVV